MRVVPPLRSHMWGAGRRLTRLLDTLSAALTRATTGTKGRPGLTLAGVSRHWHSALRPPANKKTSEKLPQVSAWAGKLLVLISFGAKLHGRCSLRMQGPLTPTIAPAPRSLRVALRGI